MKIAYLVYWDICSGDGVSKKILSQAKTWGRLGAEVRIFMRNHKSDECLEEMNLIKTYNANFFQKYLTGGELLTSLDDYRPDIVYARSETYKPFLKKLTSRFKLVVEVNSDVSRELRLLATRSPRDMLKWLYHLSTRHKWLNLVSGMVAVTGEIARELKMEGFKDIPMEVVPNSLVLEDYEVIPRIPSENTPVLYFMGTGNAPWHGVDKILELARATIGKLNFILVGLSDSWRSLSDSLPNVEAYGFLPKEEYSVLMTRSDIGIGTLAAHRKKMDEVCPLKVREYLAYGLPVILGYKDTAFIGKELPDWVLEIDNTEENAIRNMDSIVEFSKRNFSRRLTHDMVAPFISADIVERRRIDFFEKIIS